MIIYINGGPYRVQTLKTQAMNFIKTLILITLLSSCSSFDKGKNIEGNPFMVTIKQTVYNAFVQNTFVINENKLIIYERKTNENGVITLIKIYSKRIKQNDLQSIDNMLFKILSLKSEYIKPALGGIRWEVFLKYRGDTKNVVLENYSLKETNELFNFINSLIAKSKPHIHIYK